MPDVISDANHSQSSNDHVAAAAAGKMQQELHETVTIYAVTNRHLAKDGKSFEDGGLDVKKDDTVHYYKEEVPVAGKAGDLKATGPGKIEVIDKAQFDQETKDAVQHSGGKLGIYTHGIRNATGEPGQKAAELSADSGETFVVEDWASTKAVKASSSLGNAMNILRQENADYTSSAQSQTMINNSVEELANKFGAQNIDLVAHSRGAINQVRLLTDLQAKSSAPVHSATFAHSDVDVSDFAHALPDFYKGTDHINVLYSPSDSALGWSALQKKGEANLSDGCTITDTCRLGNVGAQDQYLQNQAKGLVGPGYFLSMKDVTNDVDDNGHLMTSKTVGQLLTTPDIWGSKINEIKDGPSYKDLDPDHMTVTLTAKADDKTHKADTNKRYVAVLDQDQVNRDFVSESPEVQAARSQRLAAKDGQHWLPFENIWASNDVTAKTH